MRGEYNLKWNYFEGQSEAEMLDEMERDRVWGRATQPLGSKDERLAWQRLGIEDPHQVLGDNATRKSRQGQPVCGHPANCLRQSAKRWKSLMRGTAGAGPRFASNIKALSKTCTRIVIPAPVMTRTGCKRWVWAWDQIKDSRYFRD